MIALPFGVADAAGGIGIFRLLPVGVDAIDLRDGHRLWTSLEKALPIAISGNNVLARLFTDDNTVLEFIVLDARDGHVVVRSASIELPHPVTTSSPGFTVRAEGVASRFRVSWSAPARYAGGAPPPRAIVDSVSAAAHVFELDTTSGELAEAGKHATVAPQAPAPSVTFELASDDTVIARDAAGAELWRHALGQRSHARWPLRP